MPRQRWGFFQGGIFSGHDPSIGKRGHKNLPPRLDFGVAYYDRATPVITEGNERAIERPTAPLRMSDRPTATPRRRAIGPGAKGETSGVRACGRAGASPRAMRARRPPFLDALARTSWCVRSDRGGARAWKWKCSERRRACVETARARRAWRRRRGRAMWGVGFFGRARERGWRGVRARGLRVRGVRAWRACGGVRAAACARALRAWVVRARP